jgi:hypothetical protein
MGEIGQDVRGLHVCWQTDIVRCNNWAMFNLMVSCHSISGLFAKLRQVTIGFFVSVHPYKWNSSGPTGRIVMKICVWLFFENLSRKSKIWQEKRVLFMNTYVHLWQYLAELFLNWEIFQTKVVGKIKTHILFSITFFFWRGGSCHLRCNIEKHGRAGEATDDIITRPMRVACRITKATNTLPEYVILTPFSRQQWLSERASVLCLCVYCLRCNELEQHSSNCRGKINHAQRDSLAKCLIEVSSDTVLKIKISINVDSFFGSLWKVSTPIS